MDGYIYGYLRASTKEQDADRARESLERFAESNGRRIAAWYVENETGTTLDRPKLMELIDTARKGDVILLEQVDRLSRLNADDWAKLRGIIDERGLLIVSLDLPTSHGFLNAKADEFQHRMNMALNGMMLEMLAAIARKDYLDRRRRQAEGIAKARANGKYGGRQANTQKHELVIKLREQGNKIDDIVTLSGMSRANVFLVLKKHRENQQ